MLSHSASATDWQQTTSDQSQRVPDNSTSQEKAQVVTMASDTGSPSTEPIGPDSHLFAEERSHLSRADAASKRQRVAQICAGERDDSDDESYDPEESPRKKTRANTSAAALKKGKVPQKATNVSTITPSPSTSASEPQTPKPKTKRIRFQPRKDLAPEATGGGSTPTDGIDRESVAALVEPDKNFNVSDNSSLAQLKAKVLGNSYHSGASLNDPAQNFMPTRGAEAPAPYLGSIMSRESRQIANAINGFVASQIQGIESDLKSARQEVEEGCREIKALKAEIKKLERKNDRLAKMKPTESQEIFRLMTEISALRSKPEGYQKLRMIDDQIEDRWYAISYGIRTLSHIVAEGIARSPGRGPESPLFPHILGQALEAGPGNYHRCVALLRNWFWRCVVKLVIVSENGQWPAPIGRAFAEYYRQLQSLLERDEVSAEFVSQVKSISCCGIEEAHETLSQRPSGPGEYALSIIGDRMRAAKEQIMSDLEALWPATEKERQDIDNNLREVINKSRQLGRALMSSKAIFRIGSLEPFTLPPAADSEGAQPTHHIVVNPSLWKKGTVDGDLLDKDCFLQLRQTFPPTVSEA